MMTISTVIIAERLSARQLISRRVKLCMYVYIYYIHVYNIIFLLIVEARRPICHNTKKQQQQNKKLQLLSMIKSNVHAVAWQYYVLSVDDDCSLV